MAEVDPLKLMRDSATLDAFRSHQRAVRAAAQPWLTIGLVTALLQIGLVLYELLFRNFRDPSLIFSLLMVASGLSFALAGLRAWRFRRAHPLMLPETQPGHWQSRGVR